MSLRQTAIDLRQKRAKCVADAGKIVTKASDENRGMNPEEQEQWNNLHDESQELWGRIEPIEKQLEADAAITSIEDRGADAPGRENIAPTFGENRQELSKRELRAQRNRILRAWILGRPIEDKRDRQIALRSGLQFGGLPMAEFRLMDDFERPKTLAEARALVREQRDMSTTAGAGGDTIPQGFVPRIESAMLAFGGMRQLATVLRTDSGNALPYPTDDDTSQTGELLAENTEAAVQAIATGNVTFNSFKYSSKVVKVSLELIQDTGIDLEGHIGQKLGERIARILNTHFTTGTGSGQPNGVITGATVGVTAASSSAVTYDELLDLKHSVDPDYRNGASWMFNDSTLKAVKKLKDSQNRPLWQAGIAIGEPDSIDGDPFAINQHVASFAVNALTVAYGAFEKYIIRDVMNVELYVLRERFLTAGQVAFLVFSRHDGDLLDAGTHPIKTLKMAAV